MKPQSTIAFTTLGCRVNQYDTQAMKEQAEKASLAPVSFDQRADIYVINTCTVTAERTPRGSNWSAGPKPKIRRLL